MIKITYDAEADALYIQFLETTVTTEHLAEGFAADYDAEGRLVGIEILDASQRFGGAQTLRQVMLEDVGLVRAWPRGCKERAAHEARGALPPWKQGAMSLPRLRRAYVRVGSGEPFRLPESGRVRGHQKLREYTDFIMYRIAALLPEEYRGVYG